ncbi:hypothetical protein [Mycoplasma struthionis]|nr:hypothetical protein [Mycoplasma struthionis]
MQNITHPYFSMIIEDHKSKQIIHEPCAMFSLAEKNEYYAVVCQFGRKNNLNSLFYYRTFHNLIKDFNPSINFKSHYDNFDIPFIKTKKPDYCLQMTQKPELKEDLVGWAEDRAFQYAVRDFNIDPFKRYNILLQGFFEGKPKNDK